MRSHQKRSFLPPQTLSGLYCRWLHPLWKRTDLLCVFSTRALLLQASICQTRDSKTGSPALAVNTSGLEWGKVTLSVLVWMGCGSVIGPVIAKSIRGSIEAALCECTRPLSWTQFPHTHFHSDHWDIDSAESLAAHRLRDHEKTLIFWDTPMLKFSPISISQ